MLDYGIFDSYPVSGAEIRGVLDGRGHEGVDALNDLEEQVNGVHREALNAVEGNLVAEVDGRYGSRRRTTAIDPGAHVHQPLT